MSTPERAMALAAKLVIEKSDCGGWVISRAQ
jgi:hypothetical protein